MPKSPSKKSKTSPKAKPPSPSPSPEPEFEDETPEGMSWFWLIIPILVAAFYAWFLQKSGVIQMPNIFSKILTTEGEAITDIYDLRVLTDSLVFDVVDMKGKGKGLVAARDIQQGELVIQEKPLLIVPDEDIPESLLSPILENLTSAQSKALFSLSYSRLKNEKGEEVNLDPATQTSRDRFLVAEGIVTNNAVGIKVDGKNTLGVFPRMARLNHACASAYNLAYGWRNDEEELRVYALKDIQKGEELTISYIESRRPREERQAKLRESYGFSCTCAVCTLPPDESKKSDELLPQFTEIYTRFSRWYKGHIDGKEAIKVMNELWKLTTDTGYVRERGRWAQEAAYVATCHGDQESARKWLQLAIKWQGIETGVDSEKTTALQFTLDNLVEHLELGSKKVMQVGEPIA